MSLRRPLVVLACVIGLVAAGGYAWYANRVAPGPQAVAGGGAAPGGAEAPAVAVEVEVVRSRTVVDEVSAVGSLVSNESVVLRPEVAGRIEAIRFREGAPVKAGAVLVELDAAVERAELQQARANLTLAESNFRRTQDLFGRKFVSQSSLDDARAKLEVARAGPALAQARLARMQIRAPFDGVVGIRSVSPGDFVKEGDALINLEDIATLKVDFRLPELYLDRVRPGQGLELTSDVLPDERFPAEVDAIDPLVDAQGRSIVLRAKLANPEGRLRPGMFVRVRVMLAERPEVLVVPEEALVPAPGGVAYVYRVVGERAQRVDVKTGVRRDAQVEILEGLAPGDAVVTAGQLKLRDGARVTLAAAAAEVQAARAAD